MQVIVNVKPGLGQRERLNMLLTPVSGQPPTYEFVVTLWCRNDSKQNHLEHGIKIRQIYDEPQ
ncbi:hypothetical protein Tdes44962_MAKER03371 [Teratosphaeria destructans]|uniref:Uncharacterized protein n=1 Tax=Teratosphaeria destructans TaxID=418781 RepID=A0A9W7SQC9_9PEZI|nr:hypothetical protein Tdes44962_MAKER03371 [Teratosphaeria destructans]